MRTIGSYWPYATTVFDYVRRSMPYLQSQSLSDNEVYAVTAYLLNLNGIIGDNDEMNAQTLPKVKMPNQVELHRRVSGAGEVAVARDSRRAGMLAR